jgi:hypothetical protein
MLKNILNLEDVQALNKNQQQAINGGYVACDEGCMMVILACRCD